MFYDCSDIDKDLLCSFCGKRFVDVVKLIPDCGESICNYCHENLKDESCQSGEFKCRACQEAHSMPKNGLPSVKNIHRILARQRVEKPLTDEARRLKSQLGSLQEQLRAVKTFNRRDYINSYCDQLGLEVREAIESAMKNLNEIESDLLQEIETYRSSCLESSLNDTTTENERLEELSKEIGEFNDRWSAYFSKVEALATEGEVEAALDRTREFELRIKAVEARLEPAALDGQLMVFKPQDDLFGSKSNWVNKYGLRMDVEETKVFLIQPASFFPTALNETSHQVFFMPDGRPVSCPTDTTIKIWNHNGGTTPQKVIELAKRASCSTTLPNDWLAIASADHSITIWDPTGAAARQVRTLVGHTCVIVHLLALNNGHLASYSLDDTIKIWDPFLADKNLIRSISGHGNKMTLLHMAILSDNNLMTCSRDEQALKDGILRVWNPSNGQKLKSMLTGTRNVTALLALSNGDVAVGSLLGAIKLMSLEDGRVKALIQAHSCHVFSLLQLSNGFIVSSGDEASGSSAIKVWNPLDYSLIQTIITGYEDTITSMGVSVGKKLLISASSISSVKVWSIGD